MKRKAPLTIELSKEYMDGLIDRKPLLGCAEIAQLFRLGGSATGVIRTPDFPSPYQELRCGRVWRTSAVLMWGLNNGRIKESSK